MRFSSIVICGPGKVRPENQDNFYLNGVFRNDLSDNGLQRIQNRAVGQALYAIADGMGGQTHGETASFYTVRDMDSIDLSVGYQGVISYLMDCNEEICRFIDSNKGVRSGSTFVGLYFNGSEVSVINIGDSRAYRLRGTWFCQISKDHTAVQRMLNMGLIRKEQLRIHPERHKLSQHLGIFPDEMIIEPYSATDSLLPGDLYLLCSDGLYEMVEDEEIQNALLMGGSISDKATELYQRAMERGGVDNITVMLIEVESEEQIPIDATI